MKRKTCIVPLLILVGASSGSDLSKVIDALKAVESRNNPNAVSRDGGAVGVLQIRKPMVKEVNRILNLKHGGNKKFYAMADRYDAQKSTDMAFIFYTFWRGRWPQMDDVELGGRWYSPAGNAPTWYKERLREELKK